ncbi:hypothetical protein CPC08DRAFT_648444, partial [Agrocybe pediades]
IFPGRYMSNNSVYSIIASTLAVYDIKPPTDEDGKPVVPKREFTDGLITYVTFLYPVPFKYIITPRNSPTEDLIRESSSVTNND